MGFDNADMRRKEAVRLTTRAATLFLHQAITDKDQKPVFQSLL
jgi:hypothetical protein